MDERLRRASEEGNVSDLYSLIQEDGNVLKRIDEVEFISTPLHVAADAGCVDFAMEIMSLKPSFARKLDQQGLSPIHLAVQKGHKQLVLNLMETANDLVRLKGKNGETPLHYVITREEKPQLLPRFLEDCPESIRDVTTENQTALHIAVSNNKEEALKILCNMLRKTDYCQDVVNRKDKNGDSALHIAARENKHEMIKVLLKCKADKHATNKASSTALDVAQQLNNTESIRILSCCFIPRVSTFIEKLQKQVVKYVTKASSIIFHDMDNISSEDRNALLVILGLLLTATYQASLSPPGSVWQGEGFSNLTANGNVNDLLGKSVMTKSDFLYFYIPTSLVFIVTFFLTLGLLKPFPHGFRTALQILLSFLAICFDQSISLLAPTPFAAKTINFLLILVFLLMMFMSISYRVSKISVSILGCWLYPIYDSPAGNVILGCLLFLFLYDELWQGWLVVVGYCLLVPLANQALITELLILLGCWLFLSLCRFFIKRYKDRCNACTVQ
ncbi:hypothetical protein PTKIN_Ptkin16aG0486600 [Pterospermum kingtungense]